MDIVTFSPIGIYHSQIKRSYELPRQPDNSKSLPGFIELKNGGNFEVALDGLLDFDKIWILFVFNQSKGWRPKVLPPKLNHKVGLFSTRSPHRPCPIGMSCVDLIKIDGRKVYVNGADLLHGTAVLDLKPYISFCDSFPKAKSGWVDTALQKRNDVSWSSLAQQQRQWLLLYNVNIEEDALDDLVFFRGGNHYNRIQKIAPDLYIKAYKQWRLIFKITGEKSHVHICLVMPGYHMKDLQKEHQPMLPEYFYLFSASFSQSIFAFLQDSCNMKPEDLYTRI